MKHPLCLIIILLTVLSCTVSPVFMDLGDKDLLAQNIIGGYGDYFPLKNKYCIEYEVAEYSNGIKIEEYYNLRAFTNNVLVLAGKVHVYDRVMYTAIDTSYSNVSHEYFIRETEDEALFYNNGGWDAWATLPPLPNGEWSYQSGGSTVNCKWTNMDCQVVPVKTFYNCWGIIRRVGQNESIYIYAPDYGLIRLTSSWTAGGVAYTKTEAASLILEDYSQYDGKATWK